MTHYDKRITEEPYQDPNPAPIRTVADLIRKQESPQSIEAKQCSEAIASSNAVKEVSDPVQAPCINGGTCPQNKIVAATQTHGKRCGIIMIDIKQLPDYKTGVQECPLARNARLKGTKPAGFHVAGTGAASRSHEVLKESEQERREKLAKEWLATMPEYTHRLIAGLQEEYPHIKTISNLLDRALEVMSEKGDY